MQLFFLSGCGHTRLINKMVEIVVLKVCCCCLHVSANTYCTLNTASCMYPLKAGGPYHGREWCSSISVWSCRSSDAVFPLFGASAFCSVTPVTTHPFCEVTIIIVVIVHNESRQEPERHVGSCAGSLLVQQMKVCSRAEWHRGYKDNAELTY